MWPKLSDDDADSPVVWIELGGQLNRLEDGAGTNCAAFLRIRFQTRALLRHWRSKKPPLYSLTKMERSAFQPEGSDWVFSVSVRYGRSEAIAIAISRQTIRPWVLAQWTGGARHRYAETTTSNSETHEILDFMAGKDIGLGVLGRGGTSILSGGIRFAQFRPNPA